MASGTNLLHAGLLRGRQHHLLVLLLLQLQLLLLLLLLWGSSV